MRPPRRMETPTTPKFDPGTTNYSKSTVQESIQQWVKEQNEIGHKTRYVPRQGLSPKRDEISHPRKGNETQFPRQRERTPRKQLFPRKLNQENEEVNVPVRAIGSQVRIESLEELQERSIPISPTQRPAEGEGEVTSPNPSKPDYYAHTPPRVCQGTPIRPTQPEVIYEREPRRTTRYPTGQGPMVKGEE